jgi:hypothetical protein
MEGTGCGEVLEELPKLRLVTVEGAANASHVPVVHLGRGSMLQGSG